MLLTNVSGWFWDSYNNRSDQEIYRRPTVNRVRVFTSKELLAPIIGQVQSESVYPGKSIDDLLVFELPVEKAKYLRLELPASAFHGEGKLRIQIPADMIQR